MKRVGEFQSILRLHARYSEQLRFCLHLPPALATRVSLKAKDWQILVAGALSFANTTSTHSAYREDRLILENV